MASVFLVRGLDKWTRVAGPPARRHSH